VKKQLSNKEGSSEEDLSAESEELEVEAISSSFLISSVGGGGRGKGTDYILHGSESQTNYT